MYTCKDVYERSYIDNKNNYYLEESSWALWYLKRTELSPTLSHRKLGLTSSFT